MQSCGFHAALLTYESGFQNYSRTESINCFIEFSALYIVYDSNITSVVLFFGISAAIKSSDRSKMSCKANLFEAILELAGRTLLFH